MSAPPLSDREHRRLRAVAEVLMPGAGDSPSAADIPDLDLQLERAADALGRELAALSEAISLLPDEISWAAMAAFADERPAAFDLLSTAAAGAYFMSPAVLASLGYPTGPRSAPAFDLAADELSSGVLEPVLARARKPLTRGGEGG